MDGMDGMDGMEGMEHRVIGGICIGPTKCHNEEKNSILFSNSNNYDEQIFVLETINQRNLKMKNVTESLNPKFCLML